MRAVVVCFHEARGIVGVGMESVEMSTNMLCRSKLLSIVNLQHWARSVELQRTCVTEAPAVRTWFLAERGCPMPSLVTGISSEAMVISNVVKLKFAIVVASIE